MWYNRRKQEVELIRVTQDYAKMARMEAECRANNWNVCSEEKPAESPKMARLWTKTWVFFCDLKGQQSGWVCPTSQVYHRADNLLTIPKVDVMNFEFHIFGQSSGLQRTWGGTWAGTASPYTVCNSPALFHTPTAADIIAIHAHTTFILYFLPSGQ